MKKTKELTIKLINGKKVTAEVEASFTWEPCYGADADGSRGISAWFFEGCVLSSPLEEDDNENLLSQEERDEAEMALIELAEHSYWELD